MTATNIVMVKILKNQGAKRLVGMGSLPSSERQWLLLKVKITNKTDQAENLGTNFFKSNLIISCSLLPRFVAFE